MTTTLAGRTRRSTAAAFTLFGVVLAEAAVAGIGTVVAGMSFAAARDSFLVTNAAIALSCAGAGVLIAWQRPRNPLGWLLLAAGCFQGGTAASVPPLTAALERGWPEPVVRTLGTIAMYSWPWSIGLCLPLVLLLFPDGRLPGPRWRPVLWFTVAAGCLFVVQLGTDPAGITGDGRAAPWLALRDYAELAPLWQVSELALLATLLAGLVGLVVRYVRGDERLRRQLLWLVLAVGAMLVVLQFGGPSGTGQVVLTLLVITLPPAAITIAVLRHQLLDIRLVLSRTVLYGLLTAAVVVAYLGIVAVADAVLRDRVRLGSPLLATLVIAIGFNPVRVRLQRLVDRALYGDRADPVRVVSRLGERLAGAGPADPADAVAVVRDALRLPYAALRSDGIERAARGTPPERLETVPLVYGAERLGELVVGVRSGQRRLDPADRAVLELLAVPLAVAVRATTLSDEVQLARERTVAAREEERRRLRRDLHDGLGPALTGIAFQADAASNLLRSDPNRSAELLAALRSHAADALDDVRRLVYALRPPALDELGLLGALRRHVEHHAAGQEVMIVAPPDLPALPAAVEVAAYRIATEALTNAVRHSGGEHVDVRLALNGGLEIEVTDDGGSAAPWVAGVGLSSIGERATELGGQWSAGPADGGGGRVWARVPLDGAR